MRIVYIKALLAIFVVIALCVLGIFFFPAMIFGTSSGTNCSTKRIESLKLGGEGAILIMDDAVCDDGLMVTGAYIVTLRSANGEPEGGVELLRQSNMQSAARKPSIKVLSPEEIEIKGQKDLTVKTGPTNINRLSIHYALEE